jgi:hypothetical protein
VGLVGFLLLNESGNRRLRRSVMGDGSASRA